MDIKLSSHILSNITDQIVYRMGSHTREGTADYHITHHAWYGIKRSRISYQSIYIYIINIKHHTNISYTHHYIIVRYHIVYTEQPTCHIKFDISHQHHTKNITSHTTGITYITWYILLYIIRHPYNITRTTWKMSHTSYHVTHIICHDTRSRHLITSSTLTLLEPQSRFGDKPVKISSSLSPKRDCAPEGIQHHNGKAITPHTSKIITGRR